MLTLIDYYSHFFFQSLCDGCISSYGKDKDLHSDSNIGADKENGEVRTLISDNYFEILFLVVEFEMVSVC